ncbi:E3 ubiquitin-protein ligase RNF26 [Alosa pseudoharengus]|uniref:E3 ubiquitin-protein ligase RNF26 n=1 Tax=Alosa pseudoharengus TaxID=34774 RepID=UPI003F894B49
MGVVNFLFCTIGKCFEIACFLLDLNFVIVHSLIRLLIGFISFIHHLPMLLTNSVIECWNLTLVCLFTMSEGVSVLTHNLAGGGQQLIGGVVESCKMVGYLASHVLLRTRDLLHRGLLSGHSVLKHVWEGCGIALSLVVYLANTIVNLLLISTQNFYTVLVGLWETVLCPLQNILELTLAVFSFLYSTLVGASVFLWTPCLSTVEFLASLGHIFVSIFLLNFYGLLFTVGVVASTTIYLNPELSRRQANRLTHYISTVPSLRHLQVPIHRLYVLERNLRQRVAVWHGSRHRFGHRAVRTDGDGDAGQPEILAEQRVPAGNGAGGDGQPALGLARRPLAHQPPPPAGHSSERLLPSSSTSRPLQTADEGSSLKPCPSPEVDSSLLTMLQEQEERKKCVICQDSFKTVVLLPCRHLCLCRSCTDILLTQPVYQRNCPLCRHMIFQTMDVYL